MASFSSVSNGAFISELARVDSGQHNSGSNGLHIFRLVLRWIRPGVGVLPYMGYIGMCGPKGYGFSAVLDINRVSI